MISNELSVVIDTPVSEVFEFTTNSSKTPLWIDFVEEEMAVPAFEEGGFLKSRAKGDVEFKSLFKIVKFEKDKFFGLHGANGYRCLYSYKKMNEKSTRLIYNEWMNSGRDLENPFEQRHLDKLKELLEK